MFCFTGDATKIFKLISDFESGELYGMPQRMLVT